VTAKKAASNIWPTMSAPAWKAALLLADELFEARGGAGGTEQATAQPSRRKAGPT
jgi:hypothetical protein